MQKCNVIRASGPRGLDAEFAVKIGRVVGRYCANCLLDYLGVETPVIVWDVDAEDSEILAAEF